MWDRGLDRTAETGGTFVLGRPGNGRMVRGVAGLSSLNQDLATTRPPLLGILSLTTKA